MVTDVLRLLRSSWRVVSRLLCSMRDTPCTTFSYTKMHGLDSESWRVVTWRNKWNLGLSQLYYGCVCVSQPDIYLIVSCHGSNTSNLSRAFDSLQYASVASLVGSVLQIGGLHSETVSSSAASFIARTIQTSVNNMGPQSRYTVRRQSCKVTQEKTY